MRPGVSSASPVPNIDSSADYSVSNGSLRNLQSIPNVRVL